MKRQSMEREKIFELNLQNIQITHITQQQKLKLQSKSGQKALIDISPKKTYRWPVGTEKDAQHH